MYSEGSVKRQINYCMKKNVEVEVIKALQKAEYTLNTVNSYGENLLHISAANGCLDIMKEILRKQNSSQIIDRKNKFGWSPLMLAIRNRDVRTVKYLLEENANVNDSTYLGMSVLGLAAAINEDMFEIVHKKCPSALLNSVNDDITPLCVAAMKNDKNLFFRLIELGFEVSKCNEYTHIIMKQSMIPEIRNLAKHLDIEDYWYDTSDNISIRNESNEKLNLHVFGPANEHKEKFFSKKMHNIQNKYDSKNKNKIILSPLNIPRPSFTFDTAESNTDDHNNNMIMNSTKCLQPCMLHLMARELEPAVQSLISPTLTCALNDMLPVSPSMYFTQSEHIDKTKLDTIQNTENIQLTKVEDDMVTISDENKYLTELSLQRLQSIRPPDLHIQNDEDDLNTTLGYVPEFSPLRSPNVPPDINDENVFGENTPTPPRYKTPPRGMILNSEEAKMFVLLKQYGLSQHVSTFLEQEVDIELFMTLSNEDLIEIGIKNEADRKAILNIIKDYRKSMI